MYLYVILLTNFAWYPQHGKGALILAIILSLPLFHDVSLVFTIVPSTVIEPWVP